MVAPVSVSLIEIDSFQMNLPQIAVSFGLDSYDASN